jgi:hypothetical protein
MPAIPETLSAARRIAAGIENTPLGEVPRARQPWSKISNLMDLMSASTRAFLFNSQDGKQGCLTHSFEKVNNHETCGPVSSLGTCTTRVQTVPLNRDHP